MFIVNHLTFLPKSEKIPEAIVSQHYYLPFQENQNRLQKFYKPRIRGNFPVKNYSNIFISGNIFNKTLFSR